MTSIDGQPGFFIDGEMAQAYRRDLEPVMGSLASYQTIIDLGAGTGVFSQFLAAAGGYVIGVDRNQPSVQQAGLRVPHGHFVVADIEDQGLPQSLPFVEHRADLVTARYAIHELADPITTFRLWSQLIHPRGSMLLIENCWQRRDWGWSPWGQQSDTLPLACTQTWATAVYCLRWAGWDVVHCGWMDAVNAHHTTRLIAGFRLYMILARPPRASML